MTKQIFAHGWGWSTGDQLPQSNRNPNSRRPLRRQRRATPSTRGLRLPMRSHSRCRCAYKRSGPVLCAPCVVRKGGGEVERCHEDGANHFTLCCTPRCTSSPFVPRGATTTSDAAPPHNVLSPPAPPPLPPLPWGACGCCSCTIRSPLNRDATASLPAMRARRSPPPLTGTSCRSGGILAASSSSSTRQSSRRRTFARRCEAARSS